MMKILNYFIGLTLIGSLVSCGAGETTEGAEEGIEAPAEAVELPCTYSLGGEKPGVYWTAYKHTGKIAVKGKMDSVVVTGTETASSPGEALTNAKVQIYTASVNSKDDVRDKKLREIYFGSMAHTGVITGNLLSWEGTGVEGTCTFNLAMNDTTQQVTGSYIVDDVTVQIRFTIEPGNWDAEEAIAKLGEACAEKHTGEDGETVFWPDVDILLEVALNKECPDPV